MNDLTVMNSRSAKARLIRGLTLCLVVGIFSGFIGEAYASVFYSTANETVYQGFRTGASIGFISTLIEFFYIRNVRRSWIRRVAFLPGLLVRILVLTLIVRVCLVGNDLLTQFFRGMPLVVDETVGQQMRDTLFSMLFVVTFVTLSQLSSVIGFKRFVNLVVGRYYRPVAEERVFLFVDVVGSSRLARTLGNVRFHEYLSEFFYQADAAIVRTGGEVVSYVGDAVIITWPLGNDKRRNGRCLRALKLLNERMQLASQYFENDFGVKPEFRASIHGGPVVIGECGDSRRQVTFLGDVVNMTARIEEVAKEHKEQILASLDVLKRMDIPEGIQVKEFGAVELKGADKEFVLNKVLFTTQ